MSKILLALVLGAVLGCVDGWTARFYDTVKPEEYLGIIGGSTVKGVLTGLAAGFAARKTNSLRAGILTGVIVGFGLSFAVGYMVEHGDPANGVAGKPGAFWQILLPGTALGALVGIAAQKFGKAPQPAS